MTSEFDYLNVSQMLSFWVRKNYDRPHDIDDVEFVW